MAGAVGRRPSYKKTRRRGPGAPASAGPERGSCDGIIRDGKGAARSPPPFAGGGRSTGRKFPVRTLFSRPDFVAGVRDMTPPLIGLLPFGLVCGVAANALGASVWGALGLSAIVFSGAAQIVAAQLLAAQAPIAVVVLTCFVVGLRLMMYSAAMAPHLKPLPGRWRNALAFLLTDQGFAAAIHRFRTSKDTRNGASYFLGTGVLLWTTWQASNLAGYWLGNVVPAAWALDFVVPLCFLALLVPALEDGPTRFAALASGIAVVALDTLPMRLSVICAGLIGIAAGLVSERRRSR